MSILSANTLFHFTSEFNWLISIIDKGFIPRFSKEFDEGNEVFEDNEFGNLVPMVCFCDIPISHLRKHIDIYGQYGIGLEKDWGVQAGINPVFYLTKQSEFLNEYHRIRKDISSMSDAFLYYINDENFRYYAHQISKLNIKNQVLDLDSITSRLLNKAVALAAIQKYYKPYYGRFVKGSKIYENYCYYDEREWRFIPTFKNNGDLSVPEYSLESALIIRRDITPEVVFNTRQHLEKKIQAGVSEEDIIMIFNPHISSGRANEKVREKFNNALSNSPRFHLSFDLDKVKYVILKNETEINKFIYALREMKALNPEKFTDEAVNLIATKIITCKQIHEDF